MAVTRWQLQEAKARLSDLVKSSQERGPQEITVHGKPAAVVLSRADYDRLKRRKPGFVQFLRESPFAGTDLRVARDRSPSRVVKL
jgi:antitoxin Phd